jgi:TetR/AcrR family transcriptional regulator, tetracycline repressor protein
MTRMTTTSEALARAALVFIDENGVDALTIRALGQQVGMHHTAVYRHYRSKNELLRAVLALVVGDAFSQTGQLPEDPEERLLAIVLGLRKALHAHPAVTAAYLLPVETLADSEVVTEIQMMAVQALRELGLDGHELVVRYQMLESYAFGASVFDFGGAPDHITSRSRRHKMMVDFEFSSLGASEERVDDVTESAFELGLITLVRECAAAGRLAQPANTKAGKT